MQEPRGSKEAGLLVGLLSNLGEAEGESAGAWVLAIALADKKNAQVVHLAIKAFLTAEEYRRSLSEPVQFSQLSTVRVANERRTREGSGAEHFVSERAWLFRDVIYYTERSAGSLEIDEVILRIKAMQYQEDESVRRLREQVANFEAVEKNLSEPIVRRALPDDVRLLVWTRDGGVCVRCGGASDLQFDHLIPLSRGGGDQAENIQLLCRSCNLAKSDRLT